MRPYVAGVVLLLIFGGLRFVYGRARRRAVGPAAVGVFYDLMNRDRRNATAIVVEEKAEERDPERAAADSHPGNKKAP